VDGEVMAIGCVAFGNDRSALALLVTRGLDLVRRHVANH
jgi:hypothetical protein